MPIYVSSTNTSASGALEKRVDEIMRRILCLFGIHKLRPPDWTFTSMDSYRWYRECELCRCKKHIESLGSPPSRFVNGREEYRPELRTTSQIKAGVQA